MPNEPKGYRWVKRRQVKDGRRARTRYPGSTAKYPDATGKPGVRRRKKR